MDRMPWTTVALAAVVCSAVAVMLIAGVKVVDVIAAFGVAGTFISILAYGKLQKVESNTNGNMSSQQELIMNLIEHTKATVPIDVIKPNSTTNGTEDKGV